MTRTEARRFYWRRHGHTLKPFRKDADGTYLAVCDCGGWMRWYDDKTSLDFLDLRCTTPAIRPAGYRKRTVT